MRMLRLITSARTVGRQRTVATWSPLASAFNSTQPQLKSAYEGTHGLFGIPELQSHDGFNVLLVRIQIKIIWLDHKFWSVHSLHHGFSFGFVIANIEKFLIRYLTRLAAPDSSLQDNRHSFFSLSRTCAAASRVRRTKSP